MIGRGALAIWLDVHPGTHDEFNAWYRRQHVPERLSVPGFVRGRRYEKRAGSPQYFTLYETADVDTLASAPYVARLNDPTEWTRRALPMMRRMVRTIYRALDPGAPDRVERHLLTVQIQPHSGRASYVRSALVEHTRPGGDGAVVGAYEAETGGGSVVTEERKLVGGEVSAAAPYLALCEVADAAAEAALRKEWQGWATKLAADVTIDFYALMYGLAWIEP